MRAVFVASGAFSLAAAFSLVVTVVLLATSTRLLVVSGRSHGAVGVCWHRKRQGGVSRVGIVGHRHRNATALKPQP
jgi:hypothetical protein